MAEICVNADDLGYSECASRAIIASLEAGLCDSARVMPTGPWFLEACEEIRRRADRLCVGLHCTLTEGRPLTREIATQPRFCDAEGYFRPRAGHLWRLSMTEAGAVAEEVRVQVQRCRQQGIVLCHIDSHHHIHEDWGVLGVVLRIACEEGIPAVRLARNCGPSTGLMKGTYRAFVNARIRRTGRSKSDLFGSWQDVLHWLELGHSAFGVTVEAMVHPAFDQCGELVDGIAGERMGVIRNLLDESLSRGSARKDE